MYFLFFLSIAAVTISSFLTAIIAENKEFKPFFCCFFGIMFAQIVAACEILSLPKILTPGAFLTCNVLFLAASTAAFVIKKPKILLFQDIRRTIKKTVFALQTDKFLLSAAFAFVVFAAGSLFCTFCLPVTDPDAYAYHLARIPFWVENASVSHYLTAEIRSLVMPINSELFALWGYLFVKTDILMRISSLLSYFAFACAFFGLTGRLGFSLKSRLWAFFALSSMNSVMFAVSGTESSIIVAGLVMSCFYLFFEACRTKKPAPMFFAGLFYALAAGTKTPALQAFLSVALVCGALNIVSGNKNYVKNFLVFGGFFTLNFLLFGFYNHVLNYLSFGNFLSSNGALVSHKFYGGMPAFIANFVKHAATFVDFTGLPFSAKIWRITTALTNILLALFGINPSAGTIMNNLDYVNLANSAENTSGLGILGLILFVPALFKSFKTKVIKHKKRLVLFAFALGFILNVAVLSASVGYMVFNIRFIMFFVMLASPVLILTYPRKKSACKIFINALIIYSFAIYFFFYPGRFVFKHVQRIFKYSGGNIAKYKDFARCHRAMKNVSKSQMCEITDEIQSSGISKDKKILFFANASGDTFYIMKYLPGKVDVILAETTDFENFDFSGYDYIIAGFTQSSSNFFNEKTPKYKIVNNSVQFEKNAEPKCFYADKTGTVTLTPEDTAFSLCYINDKYFKASGFKNIGQFYAGFGSNDILNLYKK